MSAQLDINAPEVAMLTDLFSPTLRKNFPGAGATAATAAAGGNNAPAFLPFTPTTPATAGFNLFSPHFSPQLNFLLNTPAVKESLQFAFPAPPVPTAHGGGHALTMKNTGGTVSDVAATKPYTHIPTTMLMSNHPSMTVPQVTSPSTMHAGYESEYSDEVDSLMGDTAIATAVNNENITPGNEERSSRKGEEAERVRLRKKMEMEHKPARGRQRKSQLLQMSVEERELEREILMEKSRKSARDCRKRKKCNVEKLKETVQQYTAQQALDKDTIAQLRKENETIRLQLENLRKKIKSA